MNKRSFCKTILGASLALVASFALPPAAPGQAAKSLKEQLAGAWYLVSITNTRLDGTKYEVFGPDVNGLIIFDTNGRYSMQIIRRGRRPFAGARMEGTAEENQAAVQGMISHFGTYTVNEADRSITFHIESSSYPNWDKTEQKRSIVILVDQLSWSDPLPATGPQSTDLQSDLVWMRIPSGRAGSPPASTL
jgi:hypothetical protein